ncbi:GFA family protein [Rhodovulum sp. ES.010]|uniref:GFA family protein n=1 Tax=Rhodovulum sp. ES.010 TaxID=1882821 RepID=UPI0020C9AE3A|nr:GFA family protein [Rhodovulum sp. ES.010]
MRIDAAPRSAAVSACHCAACRRWTGAAMWVVTAAAEDVRVTGEVAAFRSSPFAERAFCPVCGTHLWIRDDGGDYDLMPGLFDAAAGFALDREVYAERALACVRLQGSHARVSQAAYEACHRFVEGANE